MIKTVHAACHRTTRGQHGPQVRLLQGEQIYKMCDKIGYRTVGAASAAIRLIKKTSKRSHIPKRFYWCTECKRWVLTSRKRKKNTKKCN